MRKLVPVCVAICDKHPRVADGEDVNLILNWFIHYTIRPAKGLAKKINKEAA